MGPPLHPLMKNSFGLLNTKKKQRPPSTPTQKLAQKENYALFQLQGMTGNLYHLRQCQSVSHQDIRDLDDIIEAMKNKIKLKQAIRKQAREQKQKEPQP